MGTRSIIKVITISVYFCWNFQSTKFSIYFIVWNPSSAYTWKGKQRRLRWGRNLNFKSDLQNVKIDKRQICFKTNLAGSTLYTDDSKLKIHKKKRSALYTCVLFALYIYLFCILFALYTLYTSCFVYLCPSCFAYIFALYTSCFIYL